MYYTCTIYFYFLPFFDRRKELVHILFSWQVTLSTCCTSKAYASSGFSLLYGSVCVEYKNLICFSTSAVSLYVFQYSAYLKVLCQVPSNVTIALLTAMITLPSGQDHNIIVPTGMDTDKIISNRFNHLYHFWFTELFLLYQAIWLSRRLIIYSLSVIILFRPHNYNEIRNPSI